MPPIGRDNPPDLAPAHLGAVELDPEPGEGFEIEDAEIVGADIAGTEARSGRINHAKMVGLRAAATVLRDLWLVDVAAEALDASNGDWRGALLRRAELRGSRLTGLALNEAELTDVLLHDCKLDYANLRGAALSRVTFSDCVLLDTDFGGAKLVSVRFEGCVLEGTDFSRAEMTDVDLRGSDLSQLGGDVAGLRGAIVDSAQLIDLAHHLAAATGLRVEDRDAD
ncbi:MAG: pentapeptide repeat-containing protein [Actinobacteria bacterium]|nr:pentapeptide repeat-containing protein [Actinomycetota bacterium]